ncbi:MAG: bifunctional 4-hydroxy-2-oxoglutarate aldolase/2-dehydro-3-deoxy-phosphogluconate aldolase [Bryobacteraceae bacterium]|jgi:2-dehydro-3-deoxyphosphogluconate aldolase / (4S)-4-hydroxy-2-oxoglutarate aldolase
MKKDDVCALIKEVAIIPAIRVSSGADAHFAAEAVTRGGIPIVEITMTVPGAVELISHLARHDPKTIVGAGTVLDTDTARRCLDAGASFLTAPEFFLEVVQFAAKENVAVLPGVLTPTEVAAAWRAGADFVKVYPCAQMGGDKYIKALHTALPQIPLVAAGGVNQQTAANFIISGATAIGIGTELIPTEAIARRQPERIRELALRFVGFVKEARERVEEIKRSAVAERYEGTERCEV